MATFNTITYSITASITGEGQVVSEPNGLNCSGKASTCQTTFTSGTSVTLKASPLTGFSFSNWSGACSGNSSCTVVLSKNQTVEAIFTNIPQEQEESNSAESPQKGLQSQGVHIEAEDYIKGREGIAYHDTTRGNKGKAYRQDDVNIIFNNGEYLVGWIAGTNG